MTAIEKFANALVIGTVGLFAAIMLTLISGVTVGAAVTFLKLII